MTRPSDATTPRLIRFGRFAFTPRILRNAIRRDREALATARVSHRLPCGVRDLARIERWLEDAERGGERQAEVPFGPAGRRWGFGVPTVRWFQRLVRQGRYRQVRCRSCRRDYPKAELRSRTRRWPGIRVGSYGPTGARWERWRCCPRGHRIVQLGFEVS